MKAYSPTGKEIRGTLERLSGVADVIDDSFWKLDDGSLDFEHAGNTEVWWDEQTTVLGANRERIFVDTEGGEWLESQLELRP